MAINLEITGDVNVPIKEISLAQAGKIIAFLGTDTVQQSEPSFASAGGIVTIGTQARISLRQLIVESEAKTNAQKILVLGHHLSQQNPDNTFEITELRQLFPKAGERIPKNFSRDVKDAVSADFISESPGEGGVYFVTNNGELALDDHFAAKKTRSAARRRRAGGNAISKPSEALEKIQAFSPVISGFPNYHKLPTKGHRIMWILAFGEKNGMVELKPTEVSYIADKLRGPKIKAQDMNALTLGPAQKDWLTKTSAGSYKLLHDGEEVLKGLLTGANVDVKE